MSVCKEKCSILSFSFAPKRRDFIHFFYAQREELNERKEELSSKKKKHDDERGGLFLFYRQSLDHLDVKIVVVAKVLLR